MASVQEEGLVLMLRSPTTGFTQRLVLPKNAAIREEDANQMEGIELAVQEALFDYTK